MGKAWSHERGEGKEEWLTPPLIIKSLGSFDLDPCSPVNRPWDTAAKHYTVEDDGLCQKWEGRVWMNPPYGRETNKWLKKLAEYGNGIALIFARTDTRMFHNYVWNAADAIFFFKGRLKFYTVDGQEAGTAGAASCLVAYGKDNARILEMCDIAGQFVPLIVEAESMTFAGMNSAL